MALMQQYRGNEKDFDPRKMKPGQFAVSLDRKYVRMCFAPGVVERIALYDAFEEDMKQIQQILATCEDIHTAVEAFERLAEQHEKDAETYSVQSKSWAVGGTGTRSGEDANNSKYYAGKAKEAADRAESVVDVGIATSQKAGIVRPDMQTIGIDSAGTLSALNWKTKNPSTTLNRWCKIASVTLLTTRFEDFTAVILAQEVEMMMGGVLIHWNCNTESGNLGVEQMKNPCRMTAICGNGRTMSEFFEKCFFTECVQDDEAHVTYNLWYEPKYVYLTYTFSLLGCSGNYTQKYRVFTNPEYVTDTLTGKIVYPVKNTWPPVTANLLATVPGTALDATMGKALNDSITAINSRFLRKTLTITVLNGMTGQVTFKKIGNTVTLNIEAWLSADMESYRIMEIATVTDPEFIPCENIIAAAVWTDRYLSPFYTGIASIYTNGVISVRTSTRCNNTNRFICSMTYFSN